MPTSSPRPHRMLASAAALAVGVAALSGCASSATADDDAPLTLRLGQLGAAKTYEALLAASGEDADMDYTLETALFDAGPAALEAVSADQVDLAVLADTPMIFAQAAGIPAHIVAAAQVSAEGSSTAELVVPADSDIESVADLAGRTVATYQGTTLQYTLIRILEDAGLEYDDITAANLSPADALTAVSNGDVDAAVLVDPQLSLGESSGLRVLATGSGLVTDWFITVATDSALADPSREAAIEDFILRINRAWQWAYANPKEWASAYAAVTGLDEATAAAVVARGDYTLVPLGEEFLTGQQAQADVYAELGLLPEPLDVSAEIDDRFNAAIEEQQ